MGPVGVVLSSLLLSLLIEYIGIAFFWPEAGAAHSEAVMNTELGWLSTEFTRSLLLSEPSVTVVRWVSTAYQWAFVDSGFLDWVRQQYAHQMHSDNAVTREINSWSGWLAGYLREYLLATVWISIITLVRVTIPVLSVPLFVLVVVVALVEGLGRRDLRRYGAGYESSFVYHHAKKLVKPAAVVPAMLYLSAHCSLPQSAVVAGGCPVGYRRDRDHCLIQEVSLNQGWTEACKTCFARLPSADKP